MLYNLDYDYFFRDSFDMVLEDDRNKLGATGIITPNQSIQVLNLKGPDAKWRDIDGFGFHHDTLSSIFTKMFDIDIRFMADIFEIDEEIERKLPNRDKNYVFVRYIHLEDNRSYVNFTIPKYITPYQCEEIRRLNEIYKNYDNVEVEAMVTNYNPINMKLEKSLIHYFEGTSNNIENALDYMNRNNRIKEFDSPIKDEIIIDKRNVSLK